VSEITPLRERLLEAVRVVAYEDTVDSHFLDCGCSLCDEARADAVLEVLLDSIDLRLYAERRKGAKATQFERGYNCCVSAIRSQLDLPATDTGAKP
jgi:hypothetical protein